MPLLAALCLLSATAFPPATAVQEAPARKKALLVGIDGLRSDVLHLGRSPNLARMMEEGAWTDDARAGEVTVSGPGWSSVLCGVWADKHGVKDNTFEGADYANHPHMHALLREAAPRLRLGHWTGWEPLDTKILGASAQVDDRLATTCDAAGDVNATARALQAIGAGTVDVGFLYYAELDEAGHRHGFHAAVPEYVAELERIDGHLGRVLEALRARRAAGEDWLVVLVSDHGGTVDGSHGRDIEEHRRIPFLVWGADAARGRMLGTVNQTDALPTILAHLGVVVRGADELDGRAVGLQHRTVLGANLVWNGGAEQGAGRLAVQPDRGVPGWRDTGPATVLAYGAPNGYPTAQSPGPAERGRNFFCGGKQKETRIEQIVEFGDLAALIDAGRLEARFEAWLGGYADQKDLAWAELEWLDGAGLVLGRAALPAVGLAERAQAFGGAKEQWTGFVRRGLECVPPSRARAARVVLRFEAAAGDNDGWVDEVSLRLVQRKD